MISGSFPEVTPALLEQGIERYGCAEAGAGSQVDPAYLSGPCPDSHASATTALAGNMVDPMVRIQRYRGSSRLMSKRLKSSVLILHTIARSLELSIDHAYLKNRSLETWHQSHESR